MTNDTAETVATNLKADPTWTNLICDIAIAAGGFNSSGTLKMSDCDVWKVDVTLARRRLEEMSAEERMLASYASAKVKPYVAIEADSTHITSSKVDAVTTTTIAAQITAKKVALNNAANGLSGVSGAATPDVTASDITVEKSGGATVTNNAGNSAASTSGTVTMGVSSVLLVLMGLFVM